MVIKMELLRCTLSDLSSKWATLQFSNLRSLDVTEDLMMDKQAIRVIYYVFIVANTYREVVFYKEFVHCVRYRSDACRVVLRLHTQQRRWRSCRTITANRISSPLFSFRSLLFISFIVYLFCTFFYTFVSSQLFVFRGVSISFSWFISSFFLLFSLHSLTPSSS